MRQRIVQAALLAVVMGCGSESKTITPAPAMKNVGGAPADEAGSAVDGERKAGGESPYGPKRVDADKKIEEIKANASLSDDLKKQLIEEVERTYKAAQDGMKKT